MNKQWIIDALAEYEESEDEDDLPECCFDALQSGESHYHCLSCGEICSMMGHNECPE